jgi:hypothetical protein
MDIIFGTYTCPPQEPENFGIKEEFPKTYIGQMLKPIIPSFIWKRIHARR